MASSSFKIPMARAAIRVSCMKMLGRRMCAPKNWSIRRTNLILKCRNHSAHYEPPTPNARSKFVVHNAGHTVGMNYCASKTVETCPVGTQNRLLF